jgi:hypothetical protein
VRDKRKWVYCLGAHEGAAGEWLRLQDDGQEPRFDSLTFSFSLVSFRAAALPFHGRRISLLAMTTK